MGQRNISEIMREGQEKTLEQIELLKKQMSGTITEDEKLRLGMLNGNLLALIAEAQAQGVGVGVGTELRGATESDYNENEDLGLSDEEDPWLEDEDDHDDFWVEDEDESGEDEVTNFRFY